MHTLFPLRELRKKPTSATVMGKVLKLTTSMLQYQSERRLPRVKRAL